VIDKTQHGGGDIYRTSVVGGFGDLDQQGFNVIGTVAYSENKALRGDQRDFVNTFQPNRGLSVDTRGTPFATLFPLANAAGQPNTLFPTNASTPFVPAAPRCGHRVASTCWTCLAARAATASPAWRPTTRRCGTRPPPPWPAPGTPAAPPSSSSRSPT
jgi:hypothetical protein